MARVLKSIAAFAAFLVLGPLSFGETIPGVPSVVFDATTQDFGTVPQGATITERFRIGNRGKASLVIEDVVFSHPGMRIRAQQKIPPGETVTATIEWNTQGFVGDLRGKARLRLNDPRRATAVLSIAGRVRPPIEILPMPAVYISQFQGNESSRMLTVSNHQGDPVRIVKLDTKGGYFRAELDPIEPGRTYRIKITVPGDAPIGRHRQSLWLHTDDEKHPRLHAQVNILVKADVHLHPDTVSLGRLSLSRLRHSPELAEALQQILILRRRTGEMTIRSMESDLPYLHISRTPEGAAQTFQIEVGIKPEQLQPGPIEGTIRIHTDDPAYPELTIPVDGYLG